MDNEAMTTEKIRADGRELDLTGAVKDALHDLDFVRESGLNLHIDVMDGAVTVSGIVLSRLMKRAVLQAVIRVPDVRRVIDSLYTDTDLVMSVSQALSIDPVTKQLYEIKVTSYRGHLTLSGKLPDTKLIDAATQLARGVPGVRDVANHLTLVETSLLDEKLLAQTALRSTG